MSNYNIKLTPDLINPATEGSLDSSILNGKSLQRTLNMCEIDTAGNKKMISARDGGEFSNTTFQNNDAIGNFDICPNSTWCQEISQCVDLLTDVDNCGECGHHCNQGEQCVEGECFNAPPTATNINVAETYTEDTPLNLTNIVVADVDNPNVTATLSLSNTSAGSLNVATSGAVTSTFSSGVWTASGAVNDVNTLLAGLTFTPTANFNSSFIIAVSISDGINTVTGTKSMIGVAVNDAPTATNINAAETYTEDTPLNLTDIVISDVDSTNVTATLTLSNVSAGSLNVATSGAVTSTYNSGTGVWTATGPVSNVNTLLAGLTFTPTANFNSNFTIAVSISDGINTTTGSKAITGVAVNDSPTATNMNTAEVYTEDSALNLVDIVISDVDSAVVTATLTLSNASAGLLTTGTSGAATSTFNSGTGMWTASGAVSDVNTLLAGVHFVPAANFNSYFIINVSISDGVNTITGAKSMAGVAVNDAPVLDASKSPTLASVAANSGNPTGVVGTLIANLVDFVIPAGGVDNITDVDSGSLLGIAVVGSDSSNGTWYYTIDNGVTWGALGAVSTSSAKLLAADGSTRLYFKPNPGFSGTISSAITFKAWDQTSGFNGGFTNTTSSGGVTAFSSSSDTASITVV